MSNPNGVIVWEGPSRIDGAPIVVIATGLRNGSGNGKTGAMVQTWILRADCSPTDALRTGRDVSICGACRLRPESYDGTTWKRRACYVNIATAPSAVWAAYRRGSYAPATNLAATGRGRFVRLGSYGDPAAVPLNVWDALLSDAAGFTGYTHQYRAPRLRDVLKYCQVSADSREDAAAARTAGVGSFRVLASGESPAPWETVCPASAEAGHRTTCVECRICTGAHGASVAIAAHGIGAGFVRETAPRRRLSLPVVNPERARAVL